jgi:hypothetical protein
MFAALALLAADPVASAPLFRDPVHDGAADASTVHDPKTGEWVMFYTNRRADLKLADPKDVSWVHGTAIGVARSKDGAKWRYSGTAAIPASCTGATLWAPEVQRFSGKWHMWITVVPGVFKDWNAPRFLVHLTSPDLKRWDCGERVELGSDRIIDASVLALPQGGYRLWFNDERMGKAIRWADSAAWKGLLVQHSSDGEHWIAQAGHLAGEPGTRPTDRAKAQHPDVIVAGDRAYLVYFVHQSGEPEAAKDPDWDRRTVLQVAEITEKDGILSVDRTKPATMRLGK